jgi:acyl-CoA synthetase (AMP-forming)/AMP-acid ligase II
MIISGGENIYPSEVEAVLAQHPAVQDAAVVGLPDTKWGETVCAAVVPRPGAPVDLQAQLDVLCRERLAGFKRPRAWRLIAPEALPRTATGKVQHRLLRERLLQGA